MLGERVIFHVDCNSFYATVECMERPELKEVPMAVAGDPKDRCGIILAKNEKARAYGVKTAETVFQALAKCPSLVLVPPRHGRYAEVSRIVKRIFAEYTDQVESFGVDEAWLDVTGSLRYFRQSPVELADTIRARVKRDVGITVSVGISFNKAFAKLGSDMKKPDGTTLITFANYRRLVWPLPVRELLFVGHSAAEQLGKHGIRTIGDLACTERSFVAQLLGKGGEMIWMYANGMDPSPVLRIGEEEAPKSIGNGMTFRRDLVGWEEIRTGVMALSDEVALRLRTEGMKCRCLHVMLRTPNMRNISRQCRLPSATRLQKEIVDGAMRLIMENWRENAPVRALSVTASQLCRAEAAQEQVALSHERQKLDKLDRVEAAMQKLRRRYGRSCITMGFWDDEALGLSRFDDHFRGFG